MSSLLREAIHTAVPIQADQYVCIAPVTRIIDLVPYEQGGTLLFDHEQYRDPPIRVKQAEAKLADDLGIVASMPGSKGVARAYMKALDALVPNMNSASDPKASYERAMKHLLSTNSKTENSHLESYVEKQRKWMEYHNAWTEESDKAKGLPGLAAESFPNNPAKQQEYLSIWQLDSGKQLKARVQAAWQDWVVNGHKFDVDYDFSVADTSSAMQRVESSREQLRNSLLTDDDGGSEVFGVELSPVAWASYCSRKSLTGAATASYNDIGPWIDVSFSCPASSFEHGFEHRDSDKQSYHGFWTRSAIDPNDDLQKLIRDELRLCQVGVNFAALTVEINRRWLHEEIFADADLTVAGESMISAGPERLREVLDTRTFGGEMGNDIGLFPSYAKSFTVAACTTIEVRGTTEYLEAYVNSLIGDGEAPFGFGPWSSGSKHEVRIESTESGCKISFVAPQIVAWVEKFVPCVSRASR